MSHLVSKGKALQTTKPILLPISFMTFLKKGKYVQYLVIL